MVNRLLPKYDEHLRTILILILPIGLGGVVPFQKCLVGGLRHFATYQRGKPQLPLSQRARENAEGAELPRR